MHPSYRRRSHLLLHMIGFVAYHSHKDSFKASSREDELHTIKNLENCTKDVKAWMDKNYLKMNDGNNRIHSFWVSHSTFQVLYRKP